MLEMLKNTYENNIKSLCLICGQILECLEGSHFFEKSIIRVIFISENDHSKDASALENSGLKAEKISKIHVITF